MPREDALHGAGLEACFYRKSALTAVSSWVDHEGDHVTRGDLALALRHAGFRCVLEPTCFATASREILASPSAYQEGLQAERLFWRWAPVAGWKRSLAAHGILLTMECLQSFVRPANVCRLAGRFWAGLALRSHRQHWHLLDEPVDASAQRINAPHFVKGECRKPLQSRAAG